MTVITVIKYTVLGETFLLRQRQRQQHATPRSHIDIVDEIDIWNSLPDVVVNRLL